MSCDHRRNVKEALIGHRVVAVLRGDCPEDVYNRARVLLDAGIRAIEVTLTVPEAGRIIRRLASEGEGLIGAGSLRTADDVDRCVEAGARFVVSAAFLPAVIRRAVETQTTVIPGCFTPTEVLGAWQLGGDLVKVFPASRLGAAFLKDLHGPFPEIPLVPTGGISAENAVDFLRSGAVALGVGSWLTKGNTEEIRQRAVELRARIDEYLGGSDD